MNSAYLHLLLNHIPVLGTVFGFLLFCTALTMKSSELKKVSLGVFLSVALLTIPVFLTGEPAEEIVEHLPCVSDAAIGKHEDFAKAALIAMEVLGLLAIAGLLAFRGKNFPRWFSVAVLVLSLIISGMMAWTAHLGGKIKHAEIATGLFSTGNLDNPAKTNRVQTHELGEEDEDN